MNCLYCNSENIKFNSECNTYQCLDCGERIDEKFLNFPWEQFKNGEIMVKINGGAAEEFLEFCTEKNLSWSFDNAKAEDFNPISFYKDNQKFLIPLQKVDNPNEIYIYCFYEKLHFNFSKDWTNQSYKIYDLRKD